MKIQEAQRLQGIQIGEGGRVQAARGQGEAMMMQMREERSNADLDYAAGQESQAMANQAAANQAQAAAWGSAISGLGSGLSALDSTPASTGNVVNNYYTSD